MERFEEFTVDGKSFLYADLSGFESHEDIIAGFTQLNALVSKYPENSLHLISNIKGVKFDSTIKKVAGEFTALNARHVKYDVIIGTDGVRRMVASSLMKLAGRKNFHFCFSKEEALDWLMKKKD